MSQQQFLTLLSDFGDRDEYVAVMKGVIAQINPDIRVIDITHQIPPQNITAARFCLMNAYPYFPLGTVHVAVVDPGVGGKRRAIALQLEQRFLVGPDNGLFTGILTHHPIIAVVELTNPQYWRNCELSNTFHGRDIFAPVGAHLSNGVPMQQLGREIDPATLVTLDLPEYNQLGSDIVGRIQYIDHFGNSVTNIPGICVQGENWSLQIGGKDIKGGATYGDVAVGNAIALIGSHGWIEIAVNGGSARSDLQINWGDEVKVEIK